MQRQVPEVLTHVANLNGNAQPQDAEDTLVSLLRGLSVPELHQHSKALQVAIDGFLPKRQRKLTDLLASRLREPETAEDDRTGRAAAGRPVAARASAVREFQTLVAGSLSELSQRHIFQWSTYYRNEVVTIYNEARGSVVESAAGQLVPAVLKDEFARHAKEIFEKGHNHGVGNGLSITDALSKALGGLRRFLDLPIEAYVTDVAASQSLAEARAMRVVCSSMLLGVLEGFGSSAFSGESGWRILDSAPESWSVQMPFLTAEHLSEFLQQMPSSDFCSGLFQNLEPLLTAIDSQMASDESVVCLPAVASMNEPRARYEISLALPESVGEQRFVDIHVYYAQSRYLGLGWLSEDVANGVCLVAAPLREDQLEGVSQYPDLESALVTTASEDRLASAGERMRMVLEKALLVAAADNVPSARLTYNFARDFPLERPALIRFFRVSRASIRNLVRGFERQNGVRLWCSPRKSGKTTACFDLGSDDSTNIVVQTTSGTDQYAGGDRFYRDLMRYLEGDEALPTDFVKREVRECAGLGAAHDRTVLVLDEYETLFDRIRLAVIRNPELKYRVAQPLLDQMVAFSQENLLVLVGMWPDAHYVMMEQNQLSAYVEQESFPLFQHTPGSTGSEFGTLVSKVLGRIPFSSHFVDQVYAETSGHPYLTVNVLRDTVDWLIAQRLRLGDISLDDVTFACFASERLCGKALLESREYDMFYRHISQSLGGYGRRVTPWVHSVYRVMQTIAQESPDVMRVSKADFAEALSAVNSLTGLDYSASDLLKSAKLANFLDQDADMVSPRIRLMGRLAAIARPED